MGWSDLDKQREWMERTRRERRKIQREEKSVRAGVKAERVLWAQQ